MKNLILLSICLTFISCSSVRVFSDYDTSVDFKDYTTYAFFKPGIDEVEISDLDKKRILRAISSELKAKGFTKSENTEMLVSIFTKSREKVNVNQNNFGYGFGWGWNPWMMNGMQNNMSISQYSEGTLFIDFIDRKKKELIWQGVGTGALRMQSREKKELRIKEFVNEILAKYPPVTSKK